MDLIDALKEYLSMRKSYNDSFIFDTTEFYIRMVQLKKNFDNINYIPYKFVPSQYTYSPGKIIFIGPFDWKNVLENSDYLLSFDLLLQEKKIIVAEYLVEFGSDSHHDLMNIYRNCSSFPFFEGNWATLLGNTIKRRKQRLNSIMKAIKNTKLIVTFEQKEEMYNDVLKMAKIIGTYIDPMLLKLSNDDLIESIKKYAEKKIDYEENKWLYDCMREINSDDYADDICSHEQYYKNIGCKKKLSKKNYLIKNHYVLTQ
jgi:hypothetical protein